ncbi:MAG: class I SAM-dependent methyltransferase [Actinomycetota bacterium]
MSPHPPPRPPQTTLTSISDGPLGRGSTTNKTSQVRRASRAPSCSTKPSGTDADLRLASVSETVQDRWATWVLERGHGADPKQRQAKLEFLSPVSARVLDNAQLALGDVMLDVGAGDGLIAFGALDRLGPNGRVIFGDISQDLVDHGQHVAEELGVRERCSFVRTSADDLGAINDSSVDAVTTRSVLIYLPLLRKQSAFRAFHRVLKPGGRFSLFEPVNRFAHPEPDDIFLGFDVTPVVELARKVKGIYRGEDDLDATLVDFDERDLVRFAEDAGFTSIHLHYEAEISPGTSFTSWDAFLDSAGNPLIPTQREAIERALTPEEAERFEAHLRPLVERGEATNRFASAYLFGRKD